MSLPSKVKWLFALAAAFAMIFATSRSKLHYSERVQSSIDSIYQDRLLVKGLIFDLASALHEKEIAYITSDSDFFLSRNAAVNQGMEESIERFEQTTLTKAEEAGLSRLKADVHSLQALESDLELSLKSEVASSREDAIAGLVTDLKAELRELSNIQLEEGRRQRSLGDKAVSRMGLMSNMETAMLALIALMGVVVIFLPRS